MPEEGLIQIESLIIELLLIVSLVAIAVQRLRVPYTVALVFVGLMIGLVQPFSEDIVGPIRIGLTPELILTLFVPPLIFEAAFNLDFDRLRRDLPAVLIMAVPGVIVTMFIVGGIVSATTALAMPVALVFGALIAATDPVSVIALFRTLGVPKRLAVLVEGESLLNDGTAIVVFNVMVGIAVTGDFSLAEGVIDFVLVVAGGLVVGVAIGWLAAWLIARVDNHLIETTLTTVVAFGAFLLAERLHFSGVLAVVAAGLVSGGIGPRGMSPTTRIILDSFWEYVAFLANSLLFLLIGLELNVQALLDNWQQVVAAILAVLVARALVVYLGSRLANRLVEPVSLQWQHILAWGGLRGAISLALVLSLPLALRSEREFLTTLTFGVVLFSLFVQGTTIGPLLRRLGIVRDSELFSEYERSRAHLIALQQSEQRLQDLYRRGVISPYAWDHLQPELTRTASEVSARLRKLVADHDELSSHELKVAHSELLRTQRSVLLDLRREGVLSDETFEHLATNIDEELEALS